MQDAPADAALARDPAMAAGILSTTRTGKSPWRRVLLLLAQLCLVAVFLVFWQLAVSERNVAFFSRPLIVGSKLAELLFDPDFHHDIAVTLAEIAVGYGIGAGIGLALGFILGRSRLLTDLLEPFIIGLYSIPKIALAPLFIVWLGLGMASKVAVVVLATFFLVFFNTYSGLLNVNEELLRLARRMGASWHRGTYRHRVRLQFRAQRAGAAPDPLASHRGGCRPAVTPKASVLRVRTIEKPGSMPCSDAES